MDTTMTTDRYSRQILFRPIGQDGQEKLRHARVALVGLGALGTVIATQLARAGVGFLRLIDRDLIEESNLQRQSLYDEQDAVDALPKAIAAADKLKQANSQIVIEPIVTDLTWRNAETLLSDVDLIMDGTDNFQVRYLMNDVAVKHSIAWSYGGAVSSHGSTALFRSKDGSCLVCLFGEQPGSGHDTCDTVGVIAPAVFIIASLQVAEALKYLTGNINALSNALTYVDVWKNEFRSVQFGAKQDDCRCCGKKKFTSLLINNDALTLSMCGRRTIQIRPTSPVNFMLIEIADKLAKLGIVHVNEHLLRLDLGDVQITLFADGRALIHGVDTGADARSLYAKYIGM